MAVHLWSRGASSYLFGLLLPTSPSGLGLVVFFLVLLGCVDGSAHSDAGVWLGTVDTLASGTIVVSNPAEGIWGPGEEGQVVEELRIGRVTGGGPDTFGDVGFLELDELGRLWVFDDQAQEIRVFDTDGSFVRTVGGRGEGPGEFQWVSGMSWGPGGRLWVMDVPNMRFSVFDTAGAFLTSHRVEGGSVIIPWPGGFDRLGRLHHYARRPDLAGDGFELVLVRYDTLLIPGDTLPIPARPAPEVFELRSGTSYMSVGVPFTNRGQWRLTPGGRIIFSHPTAYRLTFLGPAADTLRVVARESEPVPVTEADLDAVREELRRFTEAGGVVDWTRIPDEKPAIRDFFLDDAGRIWVLPWKTGGAAGSTLHLCDPEGRYLGPVRVPFLFEVSPPPKVRGDTFLALSLDELGVPYVVRGRVRLPPGGG